jgi:Fur family transcriptional regulator, ferric uptake regulator
MKDAGREEKELFAEFLRGHGLKRSEQRDAILDAFLRSDRHLSVDDLLQLVQRKHPEIGRTTVYRTLKLLQQARLATSLEVQGQSRFEHEFGRQHHDHFICSSCGDIIEFSSPEIERQQDVIAAELGFVIQGHRHQIYGLCRRCAARAAEASRRQA